MSRSEYVMTSTLCRAGFYFPMFSNNTATRATTNGGLICLPFFSPNHFSSIYVPYQLQTTILSVLKGHFTVLLLPCINLITRRIIPLDHLGYVMNHDGGLERWC